MAYSVLIILLLVLMAFCYIIYFKNNITEAKREKLIKKMRFRKTNKLSKNEAEQSVEKMIVSTRKIVKIAKFSGVGFAIALLIVVAVKALYLNNKNNDYDYAKIKVYVWDNELHGTSVDPRTFMDKVANSKEENFDSNETSEKDADDGSMGDEDIDSNGINIGAENVGAGEVIDIGKESIAKSSNDSIATTEKENTEGISGNEGIVATAEERVAGNSEVNNGNIEKFTDSRGASENTDADKTEDNGYSIVAEKAGKDSVGKNVEESKSISNSDNTAAEENDTDNINLEKIDAGTNNIIMTPYDYSPLYLWGTHVFGDTITGQDIAKMSELIEKFMNNKVYGDMLNEILESIDEDYGKEEDIPTRIDKFTSDKVSNPGVLTAMQYYENAMDQLYLYKQNPTHSILEQSAISAEGAAEREKIEVTGSYNNYINYVRMSAIEFCCVLGFDLEIYDSGTKSDVKYRIAKSLYKPSINLKNINSEEKFYTLCSAYIFFKDAFYNGDKDSKYSVETSYYFLASCKDIISFMEPGEERKNICLEAITAYYEFEKRGKENPDNLTYIEYNADAEDMLAYVTTILNSETPAVLEGGEISVPEAAASEITNR